MLTNPRLAWATRELASWAVHRRGRRALLRRGERQRRGLRDGGSRGGLMASCDLSGALLPGKGLTGRAHGFTGAL